MPVLRNPCAAWSSELRSRSHSLTQSHIDELATVLPEPFDSSTPFLHLLRKP